MGVFQPDDIQPHPKLLSVFQPVSCCIYTSDPFVPTHVGVQKILKTDAAELAERLVQNEFKQCKRISL